MARRVSLWMRMQGISLKEVDPARRAEADLENGFAV